MDVTQGVLAQLMDDLADAVIISDAEGTIRYWNGAAARVFGWSAEEAIGRSLDLIIPEKQRPAHWAGYEKTMETGITRYADDLLRVPALNADGQRHSIAFTVSLIPGDDGRPAGIAAVVRDETERWADEQGLRRRIRDLEADR
ncbi:MAG: PAS domain S-box protein [Acidimicrobiales bacterium]